jgi:hypothetical protein
MLVAGLVRGVFSGKEARPHSGKQTTILLHLVETARTKGTDNEQPSLGGGQSVPSVLKRPSVSVCDWSFLAA